MGVLNVSDMVSFSLPSFFIVEAWALYCYRCIYIGVYRTDENSRWEGSAQMQYGVVSADTLRGVSGLEFMQGIVEGRYPPPPIAELMGFGPSEIEEGRVVFTGTPGHRHYNPLGSVHGGYAATLLDSCVGCAVHTTLPAGVGYTTLELKVSYLRPITLETGPVRAEGRVIGSGRRAAFAEGRLTDASGRILAHATTTCLIFPL
jgi:uncharacterized protein (TIGR00369 family)